MIRSHVGKPARPAARNDSSGASTPEEISDWLPYPALSPCHLAAMAHRVRPPSVQSGCRAAIANAQKFQLLVCSTARSPLAPFSVRGPDGPLRTWNPSA